LLCVWWKYFFVCVRWSWGLLVCELNVVDGCDDEECGDENIFLCRVWWKIMIYIYIYIYNFFVCVYREDRAPEIFFCVAFFFVCVFFLWAPCKNIFCVCVCVWRIFCVHMCVMKIFFLCVWVCVACVLCGVVNFLCVCVKLWRLWWEYAVDWKDDGGCKCVVFGVAPKSARFGVRFGARFARCVAFVTVPVRPEWAIY